MDSKLVTIVGGTGFVGRYIVKLLAQQGYRIRIICRNPDAALHLKTAGSVGQIALVSGNLADPDSLFGKLDGSYAVINLVGVLFEAGRQSFTNLHAQGAEKLAKMAKSAGIPHFIHMSSLGIDKAKGSQYARSKTLGERAVLAAFPEATILRPSVIFGAEDQFYNRFASMASLAPALPLIGGGKSKLQPVYVGDVAQAVAHCLERSDTQGKIYELGGPHIFTLRQILTYILRTIEKPRLLAPLPFGLASLVGTIGELMPRPPLTRDQVKLLKTDNVVSPDALTFADLGIQPTSVEMVVPYYLKRFNKKAA